MKFPTLHMNGTSRRSLLDDYMNAASAVRNAIEAVAYAGPNGRDYYVQEPGAFTVAQDEHRARLAKLQDVLKELEQIMEHIADAPGGRE